MSGNEKLTPREFFERLERKLEEKALRRGWVRPRSSYWGCAVCGRPYCYGADGHLAALGRLENNLQEWEKLNSKFKATWRIYEVGVGGYPSVVALVGVEQADKILAEFIRCRMDFFDCYVPKDGEVEGIVAWIRKESGF